MSIYFLPNFVFLFFQNCSAQSIYFPVIFSFPPSVFPANVHYYLLHGSKSSTDYSKDNMLGQHAPADYRRSYWLRELTVLNKDKLWVEEQKTRQEMAKKEALDQKLAAEEYAKHMADPEVVSWLREGAKAAVNWCHRTPLNKEERQARLEGKKYREPEIDLKQFYYY